MTHLGKLPSQLDLVQSQKRELLAYHRSKASRDAMCPNCSDELRNAERECFWCSETYTDEDRTDRAGRGQRGTRTQEEAIADIAAFANRGKKMDPAQLEAAKADRLQRSKDAGIIMDGTPEGDELLAMLQARRIAAGKVPEDTPGMGDAP